MATENELQLDRNPTPNEEVGTFQNPDEKRQERENAHQLALLKQQQGPIGSIIGSADSALTIAFILLILGALSILACIIAAAFGNQTTGSYIREILTFELTVAGYVFGKKS